MIYDELWFDSLLKRLADHQDPLGITGTCIRAIEAMREERNKWKAAVFAADQHAADLVADNAALRQMLKTYLRQNASPGSGSSDLAIEDFINAALLVVGRRRNEF